MKKLLPLLILTLFLAFGSAGAVVQDGAKHTLIYAGNRYEGIITEGTKEKGSGVFFDQTGTYWKWVKGTRYEGEFVSMKLHGQGTMTWPDGMKYVGEFKDDKRNGRGTNTWPDGAIYVGNWKGSKRNGQGTMTWPDGIKYMGDWKDDKIWQAIGYDKFGNVTGTYSVGEWCKGCKPTAKPATKSSSSIVKENVKKSLATKEWTRYNLSQANLGQANLFSKNLLYS